MNFFLAQMAAYPASAGRKNGVVSLTPLLPYAADEGRGGSAGYCRHEHEAGDRVGEGVGVEAGVGVGEGARGAVPLWKARDILLDVVKNAGEIFFQERSSPSLRGGGGRRESDADQVFWIRLEVRGKC